MAKRYVFDQGGIDKDLFIKGVSQSAKIIETSFTPATVSRIQEFEHRYECTLPVEYSQFLQTSNGGQIHPRKKCRDIRVDVMQSVNGNTFKFDSVGIDYFLTLDRDSLPELFANSPLAGILERSFYLPVAYDYYLKDYASLDRTLGLDEQQFIYIVNCSGSSQYVVLAWGGELENKVLVVDSSIDPAKPLDNVGILANSFNEFLLSLYCN